MRATLGLALAVLAACSGSNKSTTTEPDASLGGGGGGGGGSGSGSGIVGGGSGLDPNVRQDYDDVAATLGANVHDAMMSAMTGSIDVAWGRVPAGMTEQVAGDLAIGSGGVTGTLADGLTYTMTYECHTPDHVVIPCNGAEDHVRLVVDWSGTATDGEMSMSGMTQEGVWYVRDITLNTPWVGGKGSETFNSTLATGTYAIMYSDASDHFFFDSQAPALPSQGTDAFTMTVNRTARAGVADRTFDVAADFTVTGADTATLTLDSAISFTVTLSTGAVVEQ